MWFALKILLILALVTAKPYRSRDREEFEEEMARLEYEEGKAEGEVEEEEGGDVFEIRPVGQGRSGGCGRAVRPQDLKRGDIVSISDDLLYYRDGRRVETGPQEGGKNNGELINVAEILMRPKGNDSLTELLKLSAANMFINGNMLTKLSLLESILAYLKDMRNIMENLVDIFQASV